MPHSTLFKGGSVLTMDPQTPSLASGDLPAFHAQARAILRPELAATDRK